jgi:ABC-type transporter Mla subunit MlaD
MFGLDTTELVAHAKALGAHLEATANNTAAIQQRLEAIDAALSRAQQRMEAIDTALSQLARLVHHLIHQQAELSGAVAAIRSPIPAAQTGVPINGSG